ncbi:rhomboid family intramembrane serine protease [Methanohalobium sp.]|uniref:rhomboid family intramembrane serine protease n=1 Tax=Methanohalobium sp. TaxID=2837493 RepID=UPI0025ED94F5|nr:rhomboid family intramembrane serine protease [Methanohalobium sp.]
MSINSNSSNYKSGNIVSHISFYPVDILIVFVSVIGVAQFWLTAESYISLLAYTGGFDVSVVTAIWSHSSVQHLGNNLLGLLIYRLYFSPKEFQLFNSYSSIFIYAVVLGSIVNSIAYVTTVSLGYEFGYVIGISAVMFSLYGIQLVSLVTNSGSLNPLSLQRVLLLCNSLLIVGYPTYMMIVNLQFNLGSFGHALGFVSGSLFASIMLLVNY